MAKDKTRDKDMACCQELIDSTFSFMKAYNHGTDYQKTVTKKRFKRAINTANEKFCSAVVLDLKPKRVTSYKVNSNKETKMVQIINK